MEVPIVGIISVFGSAVLVVLTVLLFFYLNNRRKFQLMETAIKHGKEIPEDFFKPKKASPESRLLTGLIWIAVGIGFLIFSFFEGDKDLTGLASIPFLVGVAYVIVYYVGKKNGSYSDPSEDDQQA
ncbi:MAG: hypothetical protein K2K05_12035 [Muribaculaceae bacterium]|nr:hypothetical protein [Muribaculaceae bacterium]